MFVSKIAMKKIGHRACLSDMMAMMAQSYSHFPPVMPVQLERQREATGEKIFYRQEMVCCRMHLVEKR